LLKCVPKQLNTDNRESLTRPSLCGRSTRNASFFVAQTSRRMSFKHPTAVAQTSNRCRPNDHLKKFVTQTSVTQTSCRPNVCTPSQSIVTLNQSILPVSRTLQLFSSEQPLFHTTSLFHLKFGDVPLRLDRRCRNCKERRRCAEYPCNPTYTTTIPQLYKETDRRADRQLWTAIRRYAHVHRAVKLSITIPANHRVYV